MEGKRNRLKRKPKVSPKVPPKDDSSPALQEEGKNGVTVETEVIIIEDDSPTSILPTSESKAENSPIDCAGEGRNKDPALQALTQALMSREGRNKDPAQQALTQALLMLNTWRRPPPSPHTLSHLPTYQQPPEAIKVDNPPSPFMPTVPSHSADLSPLPKLCRCRQQGSKRRAGRSEQHNTRPVPRPVPTATSHSHCSQRLPSTASAVTAAVTCPPQAETTSSSRLQAETTSSSRLQAETSSSSRLKAETTISSILQAETPLCSRLSDPQDQSKIISKTEQRRNPSSSKLEGSDNHVDCKLTVSTSGLFSKFMTLSNVGDDVDEFEETSNLRATTSANAEQRRTVRGKSLVKKRPSSSRSPDAGSVSKKIKMSSASAVTARQIPVTKSLFPTQARPLFSVSKTNTGKQPQPLISSFSSTKSSNRMSTNRNVEEQSFLGNASISMSRTSQQSKFLGNTSIVTSRTSQQSKFLDSRSLGNGRKMVQSNLRPGSSTVTAAKDVLSRPGSSSTPKPLSNQKVTGLSSGHGENSGQERGKACAEGGGSSGGGGCVSGGQTERVKSCPLCQVTFSTAMTLLDIDAHIAACLSVADDDIVW